MIKPDKKIMKNLDRENYYAYLVQCSDGSFYGGYTTDLKRRIKEHNSNDNSAAKYTRSRQPVELCYFEKFTERSQAMKREYELKQLSHQQKEALKKNFRFEKNNQD